jgi:hypothetical protein
MATTQNNPRTPVLIGGTLSTSINSEYVERIDEAPTTTGLSLDRILDRAIGQWLECEFPVYLDHANRARDQKA